ncbi:hypothetical protein [Paenibacillus sinopodophylli]|nr:hypothetical protein [Paenibacillus sinopodophylli]
MLYWFILGSFFLGGGVYVMMHGARIIKQDDALQDKVNYTQTVRSLKND